MHPVKSITSGEVLILTNKKTIYNKLLKLRINGVNKNSTKSWENDVSEIGFNYKISEINCALANSQLKRLNQFIRYRKNIANQYKRKLNKNIFRFQEQDSNSSSSFHLFIIEFKQTISGKKKDIFYKRLKKKGIFLDVKYRPIQFFSIYKKRFNFSKLENSKRYFNQTFCLPIYFGLKASEVDYIIKNLNSIAKSMKL